MRSLIAKFQKLDLKLKVKKEEYKELPLGLEEKKDYFSLLKSFRKKFIYLNKEVKYSGIYKNFWLWNIVFLNFLSALIFAYLIHKNFSLLPEKVGLNLYGTEDFDTVFKKNSLYAISFIHVFIALITFAFSVKAQKRLNHLFIISFLNYLAISFFEFYALRNVINYFG